MDKTLDYYDRIAEAFAADTREADVGDLHALFLAHLPAGGRILDLGCGSGRDSRLFLEKGYDVTAVDGSREFCRIAADLIGREVLCRTFEELDFDGEFDGVWACASILHVPSARLPGVLARISRALKTGGIFYASFKYGVFEGERNGRYFTDLTEASFADLISAFPEFESVETRITGDVRPGRAEEKWLNAVVRKVVAG